MNAVQRFQMLTKRLLLDSDSPVDEKLLAQVKSSLYLFRQTNSNEDWDELDRLLSAQVSRKHSNESILEKELEEQYLSEAMSTKSILRKRHQLKSSETSESSQSSLPSSKNTSHIETTSASHLQALLLQQKVSIRLDFSTVGLIDRFC